MLMMASTGQFVLLYDGRCAFCRRQTDRLRRLAGDASPQMLDFHEPGVLERFDQVTIEQCTGAMQLIEPDGCVYSGAAAGIRVMALRRRYRWLGWLYALPGVKQVMNAGYRWIARHRYDLSGSGACTTDGACEVCASDQP